MESKKCESCRRTLPMSMFGIRRSRKSGYSTECKDCKNYRRKVRYRREVPEDAEILQVPLLVYPLRWHLRDMISRCDKDGSHRFRATALADGSKKFVEIKRGYGGLSLSVFDRDKVEISESDLTRGDVEFAAYANEFEQAAEILVDVLYKLEIRLHLTEELDI